MNPRYLVIIPVYNHPNTVLQVVEDCLLETSFEILIVDDGSEIPVENLISSYLTQNPLTQINGPRSHFLRHLSNSGKGAALKSGFQWALEKNYTHAVTIDADGQHFPREIQKLVQKSILHPWALILGDREMNGPHIPNSSQFGKKFSNFWIQYETKTAVGDSQSGFRIYPLFHIQNLNFITHHYDFEIEVITRLMWNHVRVENVPIKVKYDPPSQRVTHFNKWKDNLRLTLLNSLLVTISLFKQNQNQKRFTNSLALGIGVLIGTTPFYGFHTGIAILVSLLGRLNLILLWMGSHISMPPLIPLLILGTQFIHQKFFNVKPTINNFNEILSLGYHWILSSLTLGFILGIIVFSLSYWLQNPPSPLNSKKIGWNRKSRSKWGVWFVAQLMKNFGIKAAYNFLYLIIPFYFLNFRIQKALKEYWKIVTPTQNYFQRQKSIFNHLLVFAQSLVDRAYQRHSPKNSLTIIKNSNVNEFIETVKMDSTKSTILVGTHFGGWELAMTAFNQITTQKKMLVVMFQNGTPENHDSTPLKDRENFEILYFNESKFSILRIREYLQRGDIVALMADRPVGRSFELNRLFNKLCIIDSTPFRLSEIYNTNLFYLFATKQGVLNYEISVQKSKLDKESLVKKEKSQRTLALINEYGGHLEFHLRQNPEQWFNFFPFFSTPPHQAIGVNKFFI